MLQCLFQDTLSFSTSRDQNILKEQVNVFFSLFILCLYNMFCMNGIMFITLYSFIVFYMEMGIYFSRIQKDKDEQIWWESKIA